MLASLAMSRRRPAAGGWPAARGRNRAVRARTGATLLFALLLPAIWVDPSPAQLDVTKWVLAGGGGQSTAGSSLSVSGTIGQFDTGVCSGGAWFLEGGFWPAQTSDPAAVPAPISIPTRFAWYPCSPNPMRGHARLAFDLPHDGPVRVEVFSVTGVRLGTLIDRSAGAGRVTVDWDGTGSDRRRLPSGVYLVEADVSGKRITQHVVILD